MQALQQVNTAPCVSEVKCLEHIMQSGEHTSPLFATVAINLIQG